jgi:hypothetical protein
MHGWDWAAFRSCLLNPYLLGGAWTTVWRSVAFMAFGLALGLGDRQVGLSIG